MKEVPMKSLMLLVFILVPNSLGASKLNIDFEFERQLKCIIDNAFHESRGESVYGMKLVTTVVINRVNKYGTDACTEVYKPKQFSWTSMKKLSDVSNSFYYTFRPIAEAALKGETIVNKNHSSVMFYHSRYVKPIWRLKLKGKFLHGNHIFYGDLK